jgi:hypothetical protein
VTHSKARTARESFRMQGPFEFFGAAEVYHRVAGSPGMRPEMLNVEC